MKYLLVLMLLFGSFVSVFGVEGTVVYGVDGMPDGDVIVDKKGLAQQLQDEDYGMMQDEGMMSQGDREPVLRNGSNMRVSVSGLGVAPAFTSSPAQAYAMAKRAAMVEAYRLIAERINGVRIEGQDTIKNMVVKRSTVRANVSAMIRNATVVETTFKDGMCEVEMEVMLKHSQFN